VNGGAALRDAGRVPEAHALFRRALDAHPASHEAAYNIADTHYTMGVRARLPRHPQTPHPSRPPPQRGAALGAISKRGGAQEYSAAMSAARRALRARPGFCQAHALVILSAEALRDASGALSAAVRAPPARGDPDPQACPISTG